MGAGSVALTTTADQPGKGIVEGHQAAAVHKEEAVVAQTAEIEDHREIGKAAVAAVVAEAVTLTRTYQAIKEKMMVGEETTDRHWTIEEKTTDGATGEVDPP